MSVCRRPSKLRLCFRENFSPHHYHPPARARLQSWCSIQQQLSFYNTQKNIIEDKTNEAVVAIAWLFAIAYIPYAELARPFSVGPGVQHVVPSKEQMTRLRNRSSLCNRPGMDGVYVLQLLRVYTIVLIFGRTLTPEESSFPIATW